MVAHPHSSSMLFKAAGNLFLTKSANLSLLFNIAFGSVSTTNFKQPLVNTGVQGTTSQSFFCVFAVSGARRFAPFRLLPLLIHLSQAQRSAEGRRLPKTSRFLPKF